MNPILLKPESDRTSQVIVMGRPWRTLDAVGYQRAKADLAQLVGDQLAELRARFDVVLCEGAGSPAEINLLDGDIANLSLAVRAGLPAIVVGDIDRGGVFAAMYGTVCLLPEAQRATVRGFIINKFRGDPALLAGGPEELARRCGVPTLGVIPWLDGLAIDGEDSLALGAGWPAPHLSGPGGRGHQAGRPLDVAAIRFPRLSNFTDLDALALEPGVSVRLIERTTTLGRPDLVILPGTKSTVSDLDWLRRTGLAAAIIDAATDPRSRTTVLGICGGYQMLGRRIDDPIESRPAQVVPGLGLLPTETVFAPEKVVRLRTGTALGRPLYGYQIHHGRTRAARPWIDLDTVEPGPGGHRGEGTRSPDGRILGTSLHGLLEADGFREALLREVAERAGRSWDPSGASFAALRAARFDRLADALEAHVDVAALERLIALAHPSTFRQAAPS
jgi:adenosylcobyric acid synthase